MPDLKVYNHTLADALFNQEYKVRKQTPKLEADGSISTSPDLSVFAGARSCPDSGSCVFGHIVQPGGEPCDRCRRLVLGDYYR